MPDGTSLRQIPVCEVGEDAAAVLTESGTGRVAAVFSRAVYVQTSAGWLCFGPPGLGSGPLNLLCDIPNDVDWHAEAISNGMPVRIVPNAIEIGSGLVLTLSRARLWRPDPAPPWSAATLREGLAALDDRPRLPLPPAGLGQFLRRAPQATTPEARKAEPAVDTLRAWMEGRAGDADDVPDAAADAAVSLLGLGPGLTPAGDDFLGGLLIALLLLGRDGLRAHLWRKLEPHTTVRTAAVSAAHLRAAAAGRGSAVLHEALHALLAGRAGALPGALERVKRIGHTSGWDALAGAVTALRSLPQEATAETFMRQP